MPRSDAGSRRHAAPPPELVDDRARALTEPARCTGSLAGPAPGEADAPDEDGEIELPPLDGGDGGDGADDALGVSDDAVAAIEVPDEEPDPYDDADASELEVGDELDALPDDDADDDEREVDVGSLADGLVTGDGEDVRDEAEGPAGPEEPELDLDWDGDRDDGGAEGTNEAIEDEVDERALPELDADEEGDFEEDDLLVAVGGGDDVLPPWAPARWLVREGAGASVPCTAVAVARGRVVATGDVLLVVDEGANSARQVGAGKAGVSVAIDDDAVLVATRRGQIFVAHGDLSAPAPMPGWRARGALELAATSGRLWIRCDDALWCASAGAREGGGLQPAREHGVRAIAASGGAAMALTIGRSGPSVERLRGDDEGWQASPLDGGAARAALDPAARLYAAAGGRALAILGAGLACVSRDAGATFEIVPLPCVAATFAGDEADASLLALVGRPGLETGYVVELSAARPPVLRAEIPGAFPEASGGDDGPAPRSAELAWDASREVVWAACAAGLLAVGRAQRH